MRLDVAGSFYGRFRYLPTQKRDIKKLLVELVEPELVHEMRKRETCEPNVTPQ